MAIETVLRVEFDTSVAWVASFWRGSTVTFVCLCLGNSLVVTRKLMMLITEDSIKLHSTFPASIVNSFVSCSNERFNAS